MTEQQKKLTIGSVYEYTSFIPKSAYTAVIGIRHRPY